jgi:hypothetical protein
MWVWIDRKYAFICSGLVGLPERNAVNSYSMVVGGPSESSCFWQRPNTFVVRRVGNKINARLKLWL